MHPGRLPGRVGPVEPLEDLVPGPRRACRCRCRGPRPRTPPLAPAAPSARSRPPGRLYSMALCSRFITHLAELVRVGPHLQPVGHADLERQPAGPRPAGGRRRRSRRPGRRSTSTGSDRGRPPASSRASSASARRAGSICLAMARQSSRVSRYCSAVRGLRQGDVDGGGQGGQRACAARARCRRRPASPARRPPAAGRGSCDRRSATGLQLGRQGRPRSMGRRKSFGLNAADRVRQPLEREQAEADQDPAADQGGGQGRRRRTSRAVVAGR